MSAPKSTLAEMRDANSSEALRIALMQSVLVETGQLSAPGDPTQIRKMEAHKAAADLLDRLIDHEGELRAILARRRNSNGERRVA
jgi:N-acetylmuramoyl-L-alanine amidase